MDNKGVFVLTDVDVQENAVFEQFKSMPVGATRIGFPMARGTFYFSDGDTIQLSLALTKEQVAMLDALCNSIKATATEKYGR